MRRSFFIGVIFFFIVAGGAFLGFNWVHYFGPDVHKAAQYKADTMAFLEKTGYESDEVKQAESYSTWDVAKHLQKQGFTDDSIKHVQGDLQQAQKGDYTTAVVFADDPDAVYFYSDDKGQVAQVTFTAKNAAQPKDQYKHAQDALPILRKDLSAQAKNAAQVVDPLDSKNELRVQYEQINGQISDAIKQSDIAKMKDLTKQLTDIQTKVQIGTELTRVDGLITDTQKQLDDAKKQAADALAKNDLKSVSDLIATLQKIQLKEAK
jgi:hypothetical protein